MCSWGKSHWAIKSPVELNSVFTEVTIVAHALIFDFFTLHIYTKNDYYKRFGRNAIPYLMIMWRTFSAVMSLWSAID